MSKWEIILSDVGRGKVNRSLIVESPNLEAAEQRALKECKRHLMSRDVGLADKCNLEYKVLAGFHTAGTVQIKTA